MGEDTFTKTIHFGEEDADDIPYTRTVIVSAKSADLLAGQRWQHPVDAAFEDYTPAQNGVYGDNRKARRAKAAASRRGR